MDEVPAQVLARGTWIINGKWRVDEKVASGGFGSVYKGRTLDGSDELVAVKTEKRKNKNYIEKEAQIYLLLKDAKGFPQLKWTGKTQFPTDVKPSAPKQTCQALVIDLLGPSLSDLFYKNQKKFSLKTVLLLADQMLERLQYLHERGIAHRDIKPGNFVMGRGDDSHNLYLIDFGLAHSYRDSAGEHIEYQSNVPFRGTHRYASINAHMKIEQTRRDDLESLGYVLIYFLKDGGLPWQNLNVDRLRRRQAIGDMKKKMSCKEITSGLPSEFTTFLSYVRCLRFSETPDYDWMRALFRRCYQQQNLSGDQVFDWTQNSTTVNAGPASPTTMATTTTAATQPTNSETSLLPLMSVKSQTGNNPYLMSMFSQQQQQQQHQHHQQHQQLLQQQQQQQQQQQHQQQQQQHQQRSFYDYAVVNDEPVKKEKGRGKAQGRTTKVVDDDEEDQEFREDVDQESGAAGATGASASSSGDAVDSTPRSGRRKRESDTNSFPPSKRHKSSQSPHTPTLKQSNSQEAPSTVRSRPVRKRQTPKRFLGGFISSTTSNTNKACAPASDPSVSEEREKETNGEAEAGNFFKSENDSNENKNNNGSDHDDENEENKFNNNTNYTNTTNTTTTTTTTTNTTNTFNNSRSVVVILDDEQEDDTNNHNKVSTSGLYLDDHDTERNKSQGGKRPPLIR